jgi:hypothetical protein
MKLFPQIRVLMSKAYDRVEWDFVNAMLIKLGFNQTFTDLIMKCVRSVKYLINMNNELTDEIIPERGLWKGDPLSPYLFLICAEGFSCLLHDAEVNRQMQGIKIYNEAPSVTHLLFVDDSLILLKVNASNAQHLNHVLELYEACSGQKINKEKSSIMFSRNVQQTTREEVKQVLHLTSETSSEKYLGLPIQVGRSITNSFEYLKEKIWKQIQGWKEKLLSMAGKEILIKAVAQAIPTYAMACFDLTKKLLQSVKVNDKSVLMGSTG